MRKEKRQWAEIPLLQQQQQKLSLGSVGGQTTNFYDWVLSSMKNQMDIYIWREEKGQENLEVLCSSHFPPNNSPFTCPPHCPYSTAASVTQLPQADLKQWPRKHAPTLVGQQHLPSAHSPRWLTTRAPTSFFNLSLFHSPT